MGELYLVRHGQASFGQENYDQLSPLGEEQSLLLGKHFASLGLMFDQIIIGEQVRHLQTAEGLCKGLGESPPQSIHPGLNEYDFDSLITAYIEQYTDIQPSEDRTVYYPYLKKSLLAWVQDELQADLPERWGDFLRRVTDAVQMIQQSKAKRLLVVSSGGPISTLTHLALDAPATMAVELNVQVKNSSYSHFFFNEETFRLASFNNLPHLEHPDHLDKITYA